MLVGDVDCLLRFSNELSEFAWSARPGEFLDVGERKDHVPPEGRPLRVGFESVWPWAMIAVFGMVRILVQDMRS